MLLRNEEQMALNDVESPLVESAHHYETAAGKTHDSQLAQLFAELAQQRRQLAAELAAHIRALDDLPQYPDPDRETVEDLLTSIKTLFSQDERNTLLDEREQFEDTLAKSVETALQHALAQNTKTLLERILSNVEAAKHRLSAARQ
jgi:uncharacterized protein (TIGR02284 family)